MRNSLIQASLAVSVLCTVFPAWAGSENAYGTYYGLGAGANAGDIGDNTLIGRNTGLYVTGNENTYVGGYAGYWNVDGDDNTVVGRLAGYLGTGSGNVFLGKTAGYNAVGSNNVFIGMSAGYNQGGNHKLVIDNCYTGAGCTSPLIYGEFDNRLLRLDGSFRVAAHGVSKSQVNFSLDHTDTGGYLTSVLDNNFFMSSGARWSESGGGWIQRSPDGKAVMAGSGSLGYRVFTSSGTAVGAVAVPIVRLHLDYSGNLGVNAAAVAGKAINTASGAYLSSGGAWVNSSSRALKENIRDLSPEEALQAFEGLKPVSFNYKSEATETQVGFIAEDVPELVATGDRRGLGAMEVVAVLTQVVRQQKGTIEAQQRELDEVKADLAALRREIRGASR